MGQSPMMKSVVVFEKMRRTVLLFFILLSCLCVLAIGASCTEPTQPQLEVTPASGSLVTGQVAQLVVTRRFPGGPIDIVTDRVKYSSSNRNVASVSDKGEVTAGEETGSVLIRIADPLSFAIASTAVVVTAPRIVSIEIVPAPGVVMRPGTSQPFKANARLSNGVVRDVTSQVVWASSNEAAATVRNAAPDFGVVVAVAEGDAVISATDSATNVQGRATVFTRGPGIDLAGIVVTPNPATFAIGQALQFTARGVFTDGSTKDLTNALAWSSARETIATIDAKGLATGGAAGETTITASSSAGGTGDAGVDDAGADASAHQDDAGVAVGVIRGSALARVQ
jgi:trimeric autotransporter adhesin